MPNYLYPPVGQCIYCGTTTLPAGVKRFGDEHVIPLALGGNLILREAACGKCEKIINEDVETPVLLKEWVYLRIKRNFPTRGKSKKRPTHVTLRSRDGAALSIPIQDYSTPVPAYKFIAPRILSGAPRTDDNKHWTMDILTDHESELQMRSKYPQKGHRHFDSPGICDVYGHS